MAIPSLLLFSTRLSARLNYEIEIASNYLYWTFPPVYSNSAGPIEDSYTFLIPIILYLNKHSRIMRYKKKEKEKEKGKCIS